MFNAYPFAGPLGYIATPDFGHQHVLHLESEMIRLQPGDAPVIAVAHKSTWISEGLYSQQSMLFVGLAPGDGLIHLSLRIGQTEVWNGDGFPSGLYWHFINWDRAKGPIVLQIDETVYVIESVLQSTDMRCILFHPKPRVEAAIEAAIPVAA
ncbi:MAG: hypothetical protein KBC95_02085 [Candidatus Peribacteraceae bacterium]|nr:hypothetical protein [Candidatus Peribacteraceae bacterium]